MCTPYYQLVPPFWGQVTSPKQLRRFASNTIIYVLRRGAKTEDMGKSLSQEVSLGFCLITEPSGKSEESSDYLAKAKTKLGEFSRCNG